MKQETEEYWNLLFIPFLYVSSFKFHVKMIVWRILFQNITSMS